MVAEMMMAAKTRAAAFAHDHGPRNRHKKRHVLTFTSKRKIKRKIKPKNNQRKNKASSKSRTMRGGADKQGQKQRLKQGTGEPPVLL
jgi:hypothetical protein